MQELSALLCTCNLCLHANAQTTTYLCTAGLALIIVRALSTSVLVVT